MTLTAEWESFPIYTVIWYDDPRPNKGNASTMAPAATTEPTKNYFNQVDNQHGLFWQWDSTSGTLTVGNDFTNAGDTNMGNYSASTLPWITAPTGGAAPAQIKHIRFTINGYGGKMYATNFEGWFQDYTALVSFDGTGLAVDQATSFARMFKGCQNLTTMTGLADWRTERGTDYSEMFSGCSSLETIDLSGFYTSDGSGLAGASTAKNRTDMLAGMVMLKQIRLGSHSSLVDTGINTIASKLDTLGVWEAQSKEAGEDRNWVGVGSLLIDRYPTTGGVTGSGDQIINSITYIFNPRGTFATNGNVHWYYTSSNKTITIFADASVGANDTFVSDAVMPWLAAVDKAQIAQIVFSRKDMENNDVIWVKFNNLSTLFKDYTALTTFDGRGLNVSDVTNFSEMLAGCMALTTLDLTGWQMRPQAQAGTLNIINMLGGCTALKTIKVSDGVVLYMNASNSSGLDALYGRGDADGVWERKNSTLDPWFGTSANLSKRYNTYGTGFDHGNAVYTFTTAYRGGRFENDNTWWKYVTGTVKKELTIGADALETGETGNLEIDWNVAVRGDLPWTKLVGGLPIVDKTVVTAIKTAGMAAPKNMRQWFMGYTNLTNFDGSGLNTQMCTDFTQVFAGDSKVTTINISSWNTSSASVATRANMFDGCLALKTLILGPGVDLTGCGIDTLPQHTTDDGTWTRQNGGADGWMGSGANLIERYNGAGSEGSTMTGAAQYFFDTSLLRNVFDSNINVWWQYNKNTKILKIGVNKTDQSNIVTENYTQLPWLRVLGKQADGSIDANAARALIKTVDFQSVVRVDNPAQWFENYTELTEAYVGSMDVSHATSIKSIFNGCTKLYSISGLGNWDTTNVTDMSNAFNGNVFTNVAGLEKWNNKVANVTTIKGMFANNAFVTTLVGVGGWSLSNCADFSQAFENCAKLASLDISAWDMALATSATQRANMLYGLDALKELTLGNGTNLADTGLGLSDTTNLPRGETYGTWLASRATATQTGTAENAWFGTSADLMRRYSAGITFGDDIIYTWKAGVYGGRIPQAGNPYDDLWWKFTKGTDDATGASTGTLVVGTDSPTGTTYELTTSTAPWVDLIWRIYGDANAQAGLSHVTNFKAQAGKAITANIMLTANSLAGLFNVSLGYTGLTKFDGAGFDVSNVTSLAELFRGVTTLKQVTGVEAWRTGRVTDMSYMFAGCSSLQGISSLTPDDATGVWDVREVRNYSHMFEGCSALTELTAFATWRVHANSDFSYMFNNASGITNLDIWSWDMTNAISRDHMLAGMTAIERIGLGTKSVLEGTGFDEITTRLPNKGSWDRADATWFGNTKNLTVNYPSATDADGRTNTISMAGKPIDTAVYYTWVADSLRGRFQNDNAYWRIVWNDNEHTSANLFIGIYDVNGDREVTEDWEHTPWTEVLSTPGTRDGNDLITFITMERGITPVNFEYWFADYANLGDFDGR